MTGLKRQDQVNLLYLMLFIIIETNIEVIKPDWIHIHSHRLGINSFFIQKLTTFSTPFLFIKYSKTTHRKHHINVIIQNVTKLGIFPIEKYYGPFNRGNFIRLFYDNYTKM